MKVHLFGDTVRVLSDGEKYYRDSTVMYHVKNQLNNLLGLSGRHQLTKQGATLVTGDVKRYIGEALIVYIPQSIYKDFNAGKQVVLKTTRFSTRDYVKTFPYPVIDYDYCLVRSYTIQKDPWIVRGSVQLDDWVIHTEIVKTNFRYDHPLTIKAIIETAINNRYYDKDIPGHLRTVIERNL